MANTYNWNIYALDAKVSQDDKEKVIYTIHYGFTATDPDSKIDGPLPGDMYNVMASTMGAIGVEYNAESDFIAYEDLTKDIIVSWLEAKLNVDELKSNLDAQIEAQKNPTEITLRPSW